jgi:signal transduction histidine kinase
MPISRSLAEAHGGQLWLDSVPGQGSTFFVSLPVQSEELTPMQAMPERVR